VIRRPNTPSPLTKTNSSHNVCKTRNPLGTENQQNMFYMQKNSCADPNTQAFRAATRASAPHPITPSARFLTPLQARLLSDQVRSAIDKAVASAPVVLFMKGTPETPQCGFSRASIQILGMQGVDPEKFTAFNVLEDQELRQGTYFLLLKLLVLLLLYEQCPIGRMTNCFPGKFCCIRGHGYKNHNFPRRSPSPPK